jgi:hypothetical protein
MLTLSWFKVFLSIAILTAGKANVFFSSGWGVEECDSTQCKKKDEKFHSQKYKEKCVIIY